jgi:zinc/manganese transport system substrate-binding protein
MLSRRALLLTLFATTGLMASGHLGLAQEAKLPVVASFSIVGDIVQNIGGDRINLTTLVQPGSDAHVYTPTPADAKAVANARLVVTNGLTFEGWMKRLMQSAASKAALVEAASGVRRPLRAIATAGLIRMPGNPSRMCASTQPTSATP